jgi:hypothetical protein
VADIVAGQRVPERIRVRDLHAITQPPKIAPGRDFAGRRMQFVAANRQAEYNRDLGRGYRRDAGIERVERVYSDRASIQVLEQQRVAGRDRRRLGAGRRRAPVLELGLLMAPGRALGGGCGGAAVMSIMVEAPGPTLDRPPSKPGPGREPRRDSRAREPGSTMTITPPRGRARNAFSERGAAWP